ncbi:hypothetical protein PFISCL1PPCAC_5989, partial [Pristionchus fissidentatus]
LSLSSLSRLSIYPHWERPSLPFPISYHHFLLIDPMEQLPSGYLSPLSALTRTVQSIVSPRLYSPSHDDSLDIPFVSSPLNRPLSTTITAEHNENSNGTMDRYSETVDTVALGYLKVAEASMRRAKKRNATKIVPKKIEKVKIKKRRLCANPILLEAPLIVKEQFNTIQSNGRDQMWWFVLKLLMNSANRHIVAWTGVYYSFRVIDTALFTQMWCDHNDRNRIIEWSSVCRAMRLCYGEKGILTPVSQRHQIWAFVADISIPLTLSREAVETFIDIHKEIPPASFHYGDHPKCEKSEIAVDESANDIKTESSLPSHPTTVVPPLRCQPESLSSIPPISPLIPFPLSAEPYSLPPLTPHFLFKKEPTFNDHSPPSPIRSPYWITVPLSPIFSPYFKF